MVICSEKGTSFIHECRLWLLNVIYFVNKTQVLFNYFVALRLLYDLCNNYICTRMVISRIPQGNWFFYWNTFLPMARCCSLTNRLLTCMTCSNIEATVSPLLSHLSVKKMLKAVNMQFVEDRDKTRLVSLGQ